MSRTSRVNLSIDPHLKDLARIEGKNLSDELEKHLKDILEVTPQEAETKVLHLKKELLMVQLDEINGQLEQPKNKKSQGVSEWDRDHFESEIMGIKIMDKKEFMGYSMNRHKGLNKVLNKKLTYQQYLGKFTEHTKGYKKKDGDDDGRK